MNGRTYYTPAKVVLAIRLGAIARAIAEIKAINQAKRQDADRHRRECLAMVRTVDTTNPAD